MTEFAIAGRKVGPDQALGSRGFDNYSWHTDLPPGQ